MASVRREIVLPSPPEEVWEALTEPARLEEWFANEVELDPRPGGEGVFRWDDGSERRAQIEVVEEPERFAFEWGEGEDASTVDFTLEEVEGGTRLVVVESAPAEVAAEWSWALELRAMALAVA